MRAYRALGTVSHHGTCAELKQSLGLRNADEEKICRLRVDGAGRGADALVVGWNASGHYNPCVRCGCERRRADADP